MKIKLFCFTFIIVLISGCLDVRKANISESITEAANDCKSQDCMIDINKLTNFKWDKMYVFNTATGPEEISNAIKTDYPYYQEFTKSMVFLYKKKIVHYENNEDDIETATDGSVIFNYPDSLHYQDYTNDQVLFKAKKVNFDKGSYYVLYK